MKEPNITFQVKKDFKSQSKDVIEKVSQFFDKKNIHEEPVVKFPDTKKSEVVVNLEEKVEAPKEVSKTKSKKKSVKKIQSEKYLSEGDSEEVPAGVKVSLDLTKIKTD